MYKNLKWILLIFIPSLFISCNITENQEQYQINLLEVNSSVTEAFIRLKTDTQIETQGLILYRNSIPVIQLATLKDTIIVDTGLTKNSTYTYVVNKIDTYNHISSVSNTIKINTLSETSHEYIWKKYSFGECASSELIDIVIVDENNIWAVGSIWKIDTLKEQNYVMYNAVQWNGIDISLKRIFVEEFGGSKWIAPLLTTYAFTSENIWLASVGNLIKWDGVSYTSMAFFCNTLPFNGQVKKMSAITDKIYCAGVGGAIYVYYTNHYKWEKLKSSTTGIITDIYSLMNYEGIYETYCQDFTNNRLIKIDSYNNIFSLSTYPAVRTYSFWSSKGFPLFVAGKGIFSNKTGIWTETNNDKFPLISCIRGNGLNDIFVIGNNSCSHFNGVTWEKITELETNGIYLSIAVKGNIVAIVGTENDKAILIIGKRK